MIELHKLDALAFMQTLEKESVDLVFTDPPYWTLNKWRDMGTTTRLGGNGNKKKQTGWFETIDSEELWQLMCEIFRVLKKDRHAFIMCDGQTLKWILAYAEEAGFSYYKPLVWDKVSLGMGYHFRNRHEFIVMLDKGKNRKPKNLSLPDIFTVPMVKGGYPTQKPLGLINPFIEQFTEENELVVDPFFGSGTVPLSCQDFNRKFKGSDKSDEAHKYANKRLGVLSLF
jgi:site-specific DNA-methyltransferase (adenine-specific)